MSVFRERAAFLPALVCALLSVVFLRSGVLTILFLAPLGFAAYGYSPRTAALALALSVGGNCAAAAIGGALAGAAPGEYLWGAVFLGVAAAAFTWVVSAFGLAQAKAEEEPGEPCFLEKVIAPGTRGPVRFVAGAAGCVILLFVLFDTALKDPVFAAQFKAQESLIEAVYRSSIAHVSSADAVEEEMIKAMGAERILGIMAAILRRGGALAFCLGVFCLCRELSRGMALLIRRRRVEGDIRNFHADPRLVWVTSLTLLVILVSSRLKLTALETVFWNILVICGMLYLAQGIGILQFFVTRPEAPLLLKMFLPVIAAVIIVSPGVNALALGALTLLGIAENWAPLRGAPKQGEPPPTPGV